MKLLALVALAVVMSACTSVTASAAIRMDVGFDPAQVNPGGRTQFFLHVQNTSREPAAVDVSIDFSFGDLRFGPYTQSLRLGPGQGMAYAIPMKVPAETPRGVLAVHASATDRTGSIDDRAALTIFGPGGRDPAALCRTFLSILSRIGFE